MGNKKSIKPGLNNVRNIEVADNIVNKYTSQIILGFSI